MAGPAPAATMEAMRRLAAPALMLLLASCSAREPLPFPETVAIEVGQPFPNLMLPALDGGAPASIAQFRGRKILLHVFASW